MENPTQSLEPYVEHRDKEVLGLLTIGSTAIEQIVEIKPDVTAMSDKEFEAYVHWTALKGDEAGTALQELREIKSKLAAPSLRETMDQIAEMTSRVSLIQHDPAPEAQREAAELTEQMAALYHYLQADQAIVDARIKWVGGYIKDRQPE